MSSYRSVSERVRHEPERVKGSRFVADVVPVRDEGAAREAVDALWREFPDASHVCWAWRLGARGERHRHDDDGEPGGSAGLPILRRLEGHDLSDVLVAVTRWFGGTKLGVGGLVRAYGGAAGMALDRAAVVVVHELVRLAVRFAYDDSRAVEGVLRTNGLATVEAAYDAEVRLVVDVAVDDRARIEAELSNATSGRARVAESGP